MCIIVSLCLGEKYTNIMYIYNFIYLFDTHQSDDKIINVLYLYYFIIIIIFYNYWRILSVDFVSERYIVASE